MLLTGEPLTIFYPIKRACFFSFLSGCLSSLAFQPIGISFFFVISFITFYHLFEHSLFVNRRQLFYFGWFYGLGYFLSGLYWIPLSFHINWPLLKWFFPFAVIAIPAFLAIFFGVQIFIMQKLATFVTNRILKLLMFVTIWSALEWIRGNIFPKFPWKNVAELATNNLIFAQLLSIGGCYLCGLFILFSCCLIYICVGRCFAYKSKTCAGLILILLVLGAVAYSKNHLQTKLRFHNHFNLIIVQPSIKQTDKIDPTKSYYNLNKLLQTAQLASVDSSKTFPKPNLIIFPETSIPFIISPNSALFSYLGDYLNKQDILIFGADRIDAQQRLFNSMYVINSLGQVIHCYDKNVLLPFAEYTPCKTLLPKCIANWPILGKDFSAGDDQNALLVTRPGIPAFMPIICSEIMHYSTLNLCQGYQWILNITNDGWFLHSLLPYQHLNIARMRAIEQGKPIVRCVYTGISALIGPNGRILAKIPYGIANRIITHLPKPLQQRTLFNIYGEKIYWTIMSIVIILILTGRLFIKKLSVNKNKHKV